MQLGVQRASCNLHPCGVHERRLWKLSLFWGPNMLKQPVYDVLLGLISPQIPQIPCFLIFEEKYFKNSLQGWAFFTVKRRSFDACINPWFRNDVLLFSNTFQLSAVITAEYWKGLKKREVLSWNWLITISFPVLIAPEY